MTDAETIAALRAEVATVRSSYQDEVARLTAALAALREALRGVVGYLDALGHTPEVCTLIAKPCPLCAARAALASVERGAKP